MQDTYRSGRDCISQIEGRGRVKVTSLSADIVNPIMPLSNLVVKNDVTLFIPELMNQCKNRFTSDEAGFRAVEVVPRVTWIEVENLCPFVELPALSYGC